MINWLITISMGSLFTLSAILFSPNPSNADPLRDGFYKQWDIMNQSQQEFWDRLTPRQKLIDRQISEIYSWFAGQGKLIPINDQSVMGLANYISADQSEWEFVASRMQVYYNFYLTMSQTDLTPYYRFLDCLQTQGTGCRL